MSDNPKKINAEEIGKLFMEKFTNMPKGPNLAEDVPNAIWEILGFQGIEIPEQVKQKVKEYQANIPKKR